MNRIVAILALAFAISPVAAQKVRVDFDHKNDFSHYQTYRWAGPPTGDDLNQLMQGRRVGFIEEALSALLEASGRKPTQLYQPIRVAITGASISPGIFDSLAALGREESLRRIQRAASELAG